MTGAIVALLLAALVAAGVLLMPLADSRPEGGWKAWFRESLTAWRSKELRAAEPQDSGTTEVREAGIEDLFDLGQPVQEPAYTRPEEIVARLEQARASTRR
ncbi:hypothetical protein MF406_06550 [Georgenia sp. TF02-10]|uniref:hypothetical protein n=1 Tax=Georgenia sp. TF02-10 TaxID=2917725 RepID=UPI001FA7D97E|nr:hypothetical protein [Georgenia sp. TF02-10]UNX55884.1 hypothetical protein MF406_06550 [Georgenia sp. TF02-10]